MSGIAVLVLLETDDPQLLRPDVSTAEAAASFRPAVIDNLPKLTRVVAAMSEFESRLMILAHESAKKSSGLGEVLRPPEDYVSPADKPRRRPRR